MTAKVNFESLYNYSYAQAWEYQGQLQKEVIARKKQAKEENNTSFEQVHHLLFCHHNPVYTIGKSGSMDHLLLNDAQLAGKNIEFFKINRGGDITYHGPGQITGYPIFDLECFSTDVHLYVRNLEQVVIETIADFGLKGHRIEGFTGVWLTNQGETNHRKICAIGVHLSRWVTMHGFALNVNTELSYFDNIVPCGIVDEDKEVTSMQKELGRTIAISAVEDTLKKHFEDIFKLIIRQKNE